MVWFIKWGWAGEKGRGVKAEVSRCVIGRSVVFFPEGKCYQKLESIPPSIFVEKKLELPKVEK